MDLFRSQLCNGVLQTLFKAFGGEHPAESVFNLFGGGFQSVPVQQVQPVNVLPMPAKKKMPTWLTVLLIIGVTLLVILGGIILFFWFLFASIYRGKSKDLPLLTFFRFQSPCETTFGQDAGASYFQSKLYSYKKQTPDKGVIRNWDLNFQLYILEDRYMLQNL